MLIYEFKPFSGPLSWKFIDPDTGHHYEAANEAELLRIIKSYREQNSLPPIEYLPHVVANHLCNLPENWGLCKPSVLSRGVMDYLQGGITLLKNMAYSTFVTQEEADRRSSICKDCPHNSFPDKGPFIRWSDKLAVYSIGKRRSKYHNELGSCELCSCVMRSKVWYGGKISLSDGERRAMKKVNCWQPAAELSQK